MKPGTFQKVLQRVALCCATLPFQTAEVSAGSFANVGRLRLANGDLCGAIQISQTYVLTAAHCVVEEHGALKATNRMVFQSNWNEGSPSARVQIKQIYRHPSFRPGAKVQMISMASDLALLEIDAQSAQNVQLDILTWPRLPLPEIVQITAVALDAGNRRRVAKYDCRTGRAVGAILELDCHVPSGFSGAPVYSKDPVPRLIGIVSSKSGPVSQPITFATLLLGPNLDWFKRIVTRERRLD